MGPGMFDGLEQAFRVLAVFASVGAIATLFGIAWFVWWAFHHIAFV